MARVDCTAINASKILIGSLSPRIVAIATHVSILFAWSSENKLCRELSVAPIVGMLHSGIPFIFGIFSCLFKYR